ncbi:hypothetical protein [Candidatus Marithrix sp. Canyon 246]|uniref:hypothetical protein n=1 Tax=Candidatus Marithrix sp. Canyon 246 TaxID=1827136 RepID=UPI00084A1DEA|nr:hypothetical protein [Candidatus Marithrix sp. Canyon 246]
MNFNPLDTIWDAYRAAEDAFKVSGRVVIFSDNATEKLDGLDDNATEVLKAVAFAEHKRGLNLLNRVKIINQSDASNFLKQSFEIIDDLFVLALWATFERYIRDFLQEKGEKVREMLPCDFANVFYQHLSKEIDYWKPEEILDLFQQSLFKENKSKIWLAKDVLYYRNWIAHGKNIQKIPTIVTPKAAYDRLYEIIEVLIANR